MIVIERKSILCCHDGFARCAHSFLIKGRKASKQTIHHTAKCPHITSRSHGGCSPHYQLFGKRKRFSLKKWHGNCSAMILLYLLPEARTLYCSYNRCCCHDSLSIPLQQQTTSNPTGEWSVWRRKEGNKKKEEEEKGSLEARREGKKKKRETRGKEAKKSKKEAANEEEEKNRAEGRCKWHTQKQEEARSNMLPHNARGAVPGREGKWEAKDTVGR